MRYEYDRQFSPPAPALMIEIFDPDDSDRRERVLAKLDTAADISAIPLQVLVGWRLEPDSEIVVSGFESAPAAMRSYTVGIELPEARIRRVEVVPFAMDYALLGRDVLNLLFIDLAGPTLTFEIKSAGP